MRIGQGDVLGELAGLLAAITDKIGLGSISIPGK